MSEYGSPFSTALRSHRWAAWFIHLVLACGALLFLFPILWMLSTSLKPAAQTVQFPPAWLPKSWEWRNYVDTVRSIPFLAYTLNTLLVCALSVTGMVCSSALVAYSFSRLRWPGRDLIFGLMIATMMVPFPVVMVPWYNLFRGLGWVGSLKPLWVPAFFASGFNIFLLRQFFMRIPKVLGDAMAMDGGSEWTIFRCIYLPLSKPALAVVALFQFSFSWNDFMGPLLYLDSKDSFTLSLGLQQYQSQIGGTQWNLLMAASVLTVLPMIALFFLTQKTFLQGITVMKNVEGV